MPEHVDPFRYAEQSLSLNGVVNINEMKRLAEIFNKFQPAFDIKEQVNVDLRFGRDEQGVTFVRGHLHAELALQCQRCMEPYNYEIMSDFVLGIVKTYDEAKALPESYEPALTQEGQLALRDLIEDEIILNLPIIPKHELEDCKVKEMVDESTQAKLENPFKILESLKHKQEK